MLEKDIWLERLDKIRVHRETVIISRKNFLPAWQYVENMFPRLELCFKKTTVYKNTNTAFCKRIGIPSDAGGFFLTHASTVVLLYSKKIPDDVVLVHELLHYASQMIGSRFQNREYEEDFAYQESIPYLLQQGHDEHWIIEKFLLPYYLHVEMVKTIICQDKTIISKSEHKRLKKMVYKKCKDMIYNKLYNNVELDKGDKEDLDRFYFL